MRDPIFHRATFDLVFSVYLELRYSGSDERAHVDHGPLWPDGHARPDGEGAGEELDGEGLDVEDVADEGAVQEADELGHTRTAGQMAKSESLVIIS